MFTLEDLLFNININTIELWNKKLIRNRKKKKKVSLIN
jgi:hypothetical protein